MTRKLRIEYAGAIHHGMNRGDGQEPIFEDDPDRERFLETLGEACLKTDWQVHAYGLMSWIAQQLAMGSLSNVAFCLRGSGKA